MTHLALRFLNTPILILLIIFAIAFQTALFNSYPLMYLQPDVVLLVVIWCALERSFTEGGVITLILANIVEIHSASPQGVFFTSYMVVYLGIRVLSRYVLIPRLSSLISLTLIASIVWKLSGLLVLKLLDFADNQWRHTLVLLLPGAVMEGILGIWVYRWLEKFDRMTFKNARARQAMDDELGLNEEGL